MDSSELAHDRSNTLACVLDFLVRHFDRIDIDIALVSMVGSDDDGWITVGQCITQSGSGVLRGGWIGRDTCARKRAAVRVWIDLKMQSGDVAQAV